MSEQIMNIDSKQFEKEVLNSNRPVIVDFFSDECPPCEVLAPIYEKMAEKYGDYIKFVKIFRQENKELAESMNVVSSPTVIFFSKGREVGSRLNGFMSKPQVRKSIEEILGDVIPPTPMKEVRCDLIILGAGAAGLSAAIYAARSKLNVVVIDQNVPGGQAASTYHIANYPGTDSVIKGSELVGNMRDQALMFGATIDDLKEVFEINLQPEIKSVRTEDIIYYAPAVIIAAGGQPRALPADGADEFKGRGVHYCATCDGAMYGDRKVVVVGGGNSALEEALFLTKFASHVTIVHQFDEFQAYRGAQDEVFANDKINIIWNSEILKVNGLDHSLQSVIIENTENQERSEIPTDGAFVFIGYQPASEWFRGQIELDETGYIKAGEDTLTSLQGVFAAGDIRTKPLRQVVTAAADGAVAAVMAERYIVGRREA